MPLHPTAHAASAALRGAGVADRGALLAAPAAARLAVPELAMARAVAAALGGRQDDAARVVDEALMSAGEGSAFWLLPLEPLLQVDGSSRWATALGRLSMRSA